MRFTLLAATALGTTLVGLVTGTSPILAAPPTPFDWSGFYLGANVGVAHQAARGTATYPDTTGTANYTFSGNDLYVDGSVTDTGLPRKWKPMADTAARSCSAMRSPSESTVAGSSITNSSPP